VSGDRDTEESRKIVDRQGTFLEQKFMSRIEEIKMDGAMALPKPMNLCSWKNLAGSQAGLRKNVD
jgi:hypothetical protein